MGDGGRLSVHCDPTGFGATVPLTVKNLATFERAMPSLKRKASQLSHDGAGSQNTTPRTKRTASQTLSTTSPIRPDTAASRTKIQRLLSTHRIFLDRQKPKPPALRDLVADICTVRDGPPTPDSRELARLHPVTSLMQELDAMLSLADYLGYRPEHQRGGEHGVYRAHNHSWRRGSVPSPSIKDREYLASALAAVGSPPDPRPDIAYGYADSVFKEREQDVLASLAPDTSVCAGDEPRFPYFVQEWKSSRGGGNMWDAERQAMRDGSAAVNALWNFWRAMGVEEPCVADTAVFSACVDSRIVVLRVHWRCVEGGQVSYEADLVEEGFLRSEGDCFRLRSAVLGMLEWARGERLRDIKKALGMRLPPECGKGERCGGASDDESDCGGCARFPTPSPSIHPSQSGSARKDQCVGD